MKETVFVDQFLLSINKTLMFQGELLITANIGDSRAVLATTSEDDGTLIPLQLTTDLKPNLPGQLSLLLLHTITYYKHAYMFI